ncbi:APC family permease [Kiritimatiellaeota bacterium B1221]|nr:APC family permease [Kiritimatiellaeota bacterium B1221]
MNRPDTLEKRLRLRDVYALATGAMFSSGFFLLPGLAAAETGPSVILAYLVSGLIVLPTMFSMAELATALPRSGGTYFMIDRSLGPLFGTIGGIGAWLALSLKSAFALIGMGAYLALLVEVNILWVAAGLTLLLGLLNLWGTNETVLLQKILIAALVLIMVFYTVQGLLHIFSLNLSEVIQQQFTPFFHKGSYGFFATVGMVFVSYAGLTKVASIAGEVENPGRNIPLGMMLALGSSVLLYVLGVGIMVAVLDPETLRKDLTPVATAGEIFIPGLWGKMLVVTAAVAAFASTGNAGIMAASRYPMAMARDKLLSPAFSSVGKTGVPHWSVIATVGLMLMFLFGFNVGEVAKLASAFQLLLFGLLNLAVIVMRESQMEEYHPAFSAPLYPWLQIMGMIFSVILIFEMGLLPFLFTLAICFAAAAWFKVYAKKRVNRKGAIFHVHAELGKLKDENLAQEIEDIPRKKDE